MPANGPAEKGERPHSQPPKGLNHQIGADGRQLRAQSFGGVFQSNRHLALHQYVAGIKAGIDAHGGNPGDRFAAGDCPLDGRCAAIFWQQRRVQIQVPEPRKIDHPLRNDAAVADDDDGVGANRGKLISEFHVVLDRCGLHYSKTQADRPILHGRDGYFHSAPAGPIGLRDHQGQEKTGLD